MTPTTVAALAAGDLVFNDGRPPCRCFDIGRLECLCHEYTATCTVVDETEGEGVYGRHCGSRYARPAPGIGAGHAVCFDHEMDRRVTIRDAFGTSRIVIPFEGDE